MAPWRGNIRHLHNIAVLLTTCPTDLPVKPKQALPAAQSAYHTHLATQESVFCPARHLCFHTEHATQAPPSQLERSRQKWRRRRFTRTYAHTDIIKHQLKVYSTHVCPSVLEAPCSHPKSCMRCAYVGKKCDIPSTPLPWQCLQCESADPRVQLHGPHKTLKAVPAPGDIVLCNSNDDSTIGVVTW